MKVLFVGLADTGRLTGQEALLRSKICCPLKDGLLSLCRGLLRKRPFLSLVGIPVVLGVRAGLLPHGDGSSRDARAN